MKDIDQQLHEAAQKGDAALCQQLLGRGAHVNAADRYGWRALSNAASNGHADTCQLLLKHGADVDAADRWGRSALHLTASNGRMDICRLLLERGANVDAVDKRGWRVLHKAALNGNAAVCLLLLDHGSDPLAAVVGNKTALKIAIDGNHEDCANIIRSWITASAARAALRDIISTTPCRLAP